MVMNIDAKLNSARSLLKELGNTTANLVNSSPDVFEDSGIKSSLDEFLTAYKEAVQRLEYPSFRIATIGTTSSGKSTIVNALIGRKIAPIEAGEMSGGVLTLKHSPKHRLIIEQTEDPAWDTGEWTGLNDEDLYQRICTVMHAYHEARKKREYVAPQIISYVPLLPACDPLLLGLPSGIGVEFVDLPGLKSVQDRANLATIQQQVNKAFSLVALDYMQVDDQQRKRLLEELKKVVEYLQGRTDSMIFILNRVDQRGADDLPLDVRINKLRAEIKEVLSLPELPDVLPFNARLLYYAQCAWGAGALNEPSTVDQSTRSQLLKFMFKDCANILAEHTENNWDLEDWFRDIRRQVSQGIAVNDETMLQILLYALEWSGGKELWRRFQVRVEESFDKLVIFPTLVEVFENYSALSQVLDVLIQTRKIYNQEQVELEKENIAKIRQDLQANINQVIQKFKKKSELIIETLQANDKKKMVNLKKRDEELFKKLSPLLGTANKVGTDITIDLIVPVRDALKNNSGVFELRDKLQEVTSPALADDIARNYDNVSRRLSKFSSQSEYLFKSVRADDETAKKELEHDERYVRLLYHCMRQAISARAEFFLQGKAQQFYECLDFLVNQQVELLKICLSDDIFASSINIEKATISNLLKQLYQNPPNLPKNFFDLEANIKQNETKKKEVVGQKTEDENYTEYYQSGSCYKSTKSRTKSRPVTRDITADVEYVELFLPSPDLMAKQWLSGIEKGKDSLWDNLLDWILQRLDYVSSIFEESVNDITNLAERALEQQLRIIEENFENEKQFWHNFELQKDNANAICRKLEDKV